MDRRKFIKVSGSLAVGGAILSVVGGGLWKLFTKPGDLFYGSKRAKGFKLMEEDDEPLVSPYRRTFGFEVPDEIHALDVERQWTGDGTSVMNSSLSTLSRRAHQMIQPDDSLSVEQIFAGYILLADGWQTMRLFPHHENGSVSWYTATDELPASIDAEHQKYIREVFPRLVAEVQAGDWETVDAFIDRMIQYQCQFGGQKLPDRPSSAAIIGIFLLFLALIFLAHNYKKYLFLINRF